MKQLKFLFLLASTVILTNACQKELIENPTEAEQSAVELRSYNQQDCGFIDAFCTRSSTEKEVALEPYDADDWPCLPGTDCIVVGGGSTQFQVLPIQIIDGSIGWKVKLNNTDYILYKGEVDFINDLAQDVDIPDELQILFEVLPEDLNAKSSLANKVNSLNQQVANGVLSLTQIKNTGPPVIAAKGCEYYRESDVDLYLKVFFQDDDASHIRQFIRDAFDSCPDADYSSSGYCYTNCIDPRCVIDYLLGINQGLSGFQKRTIVSRYLQEILDLTNDEQNWLTLSSQNEFVIDVYNQLGTDPCMEVKETS